MYEIVTYANAELIEEEEIKGLRAAQSSFEAKGRTLAALYAHKHIRYFSLLFFKGDVVIKSITGPATQTPEEQTIEKVSYWER